MEPVALELPVAPVEPTALVVPVALVEPIAEVVPVAEVAPVEAVPPVVLVGPDGNTVEVETSCVVGSVVAPVVPDGPVTESARVWIGGV